MSDPSPWQQHEARLAAEWAEQSTRGVRNTYVYRYFDCHGALLYVGQTGDLERRAAQHERKPWFRLVDRREVEGPMPKDAALCMEFGALNLEEPMFNCAKCNGYDGPGSLRWQDAMSQEFARLREADPNFWLRESAWMADRMTEFLARAA